MRNLIETAVLSTIDSNHYEFPCGFECMMEEEKLTLPKRFIGENWKEDPNWIVEVRKLVPCMSDRLLLDVYSQFLCLEYR